jgi:hypothetical protein
MPIPLSRLLRRRVCGCSAYAICTIQHPVLRWRRLDVAVLGILYVDRRWFLDCHFWHFIEPMVRSEGADTAAVERRTGDAGPSHCSSGRRVALRGQKSVEEMEGAG